MLGKDGLIPKVIGAVVGNLAEWTTGGVLKDSGLSAAKLNRLFNYATINSDYIVQATDGTIFVDANGGNIEITMLSAVGLGGEEFSFKRIDTTNNTVTITGDIDGEATATLYALESMNIKSDNVEWWII